MWNKIKDAGLILFLIFILASCFIDPYALTQSLTNESMEDDIDLTPYTDGNMTYIPIQRYGQLNRNYPVVFKAVKEWQDANPDRRIVSYEAVVQQDAYTISEFTYGIVILSELK